MKIGAQLYTVRDFCKSADAFSETLSRIADIGYEYVQVSGTCPWEGEWLRGELSKNGLRCVLTHIPKEKLIGECDKVLSEHKIIDCKYIGLGYHKFTEDKSVYDSFFDTYRPVAENIAAGGGYFMYHNHASEFIKLDGVSVLDRLISDMPSDIFGFTLDTYWVKAGGEDPSVYLDRSAKRAPCIHLKDYGDSARMEVLGEGILNFDRIFSAAERSGVEYMLVEQDNTNGEDPFVCLRRSYDFLRSRGFK